MNLSLALHLLWEIHLIQILFKKHHVWRVFLELRQSPDIVLTFDKVHDPLLLPRKTTSEHQKVVRTCGPNSERHSKSSIVLCLK